ncbi:hypothetical protein BEH94_06515 [Candidatus Altiarchaeales archaeon WOR_SM1_SCG]|nr:hypothetical protein BEH94_06515 [Candidatus Altiarchaeales archaeon WOR_SM1_SCG]ODS36827.1 MAG: hypothetical protein A7315_13925 [Candidatus Altiarchaeales archaeon WOR_SM1_79]ODS37710.1 MAG: hypothetical protein A7316_09140 [Candidatus Altiarchaeales archaeon WOR_SM1_86-2]
MEECKLCGKTGEDLSLLSANHKELGRMMVCQECWVKLYAKNRMRCEGSSGGGSTCSTCSTCR